MKYRITLVLVAILTSTSSLVAKANPNGNIDEFSNIVKSREYACDDQFSISFGNGIMNDHQAASDSKKELQRQIDPKLTSNLKEKTVYNNIYNPTENFFKDIREATGQKTNADERQLLKWLADLSFAPKWFREDLEEIIEKHDKTICKHTSFDTMKAFLYVKL